MKVVYVAGKFRGKTAWDVAENVRAAERVGFAVAAAGAMPLIPHANTAHLDGTLTGQFWLDGTMELLRRCDAVMMVPGWPDSKGALAEREEANRLGLPVFDAGDYENLDVWLSVCAGAIPVAAPSPETGTAAVPRHVCYCKGTCKFKAGPAPEPVKPRSFDDDGERDEYPPVHLVQLRICQACLDGTGSECHTPGCALWLHSVDLPIHRELYEIIEPARTPAAGTAPKGER